MRLKALLLTLSLILSGFTHSAFGFYGVDLGKLKVIEDSQDQDHNEGQYRVNQNIKLKPVGLGGIYPRNFNIQPTNPFWKNTNTTGANPFGGFIKDMQGLGNSGSNTIPFGNFFKNNNSNSQDKDYNDVDAGSRYQRDMDGNKIFYKLSPKSSGATFTNRPSGATFTNRLLLQMPEKITLPINSGGTNEGSIDDLSYINEQENSNKKPETMKLKFIDGEWRTYQSEESKERAKRKEEEKAKIEAHYRAKLEEERLAEEEQQRQVQQAQDDSNQRQNVSLDSATPTIDSETPEMGSSVVSIPNNGAVNITDDFAKRGGRAADEMARNQQVEDASNTQGPSTESGGQEIIDPNKENPGGDITNPDNGRSGNEEDNEGFTFGRNSLDKSINPGLIDSVIPVEGTNSNGSPLDPSEERPTLKTPKLPGDDDDGTPEKQSPDPGPSVPGDQKGSAAQNWISLKNAINDMMNANNPAGRDQDWTEYEGQTKPENEINNPNEGLIETTYSAVTYVDYEEHLLIGKPIGETEADREAREAEEAEKERKRKEEEKKERKRKEDEARAAEARAVEARAEALRIADENRAAQAWRDSNNNTNTNSSNNNTNTNSSNNNTNTNTNNARKPITRTITTSSGNQQDNQNKNSSENAMYQDIGAMDNQGNWVDDSKLSRWQIKVREELFAFEAGLLDLNEAKESIRVIIDSTQLANTLYITDLDGNYKDDSELNQRQKKQKALIKKYENGAITRDILEQSIKDISDLWQLANTLYITDLDGNYKDDSELNQRQKKQKALIKKYENGAITRDILEQSIKDISDLWQLKGSLGIYDLDGNLKSNVTIISKFYNNVVTLIDSFEVGKISFKALKQAVESLETNDKDEVITFSD